MNLIKCCQYLWESYFSFFHALYSQLHLRVELLNFYDCVQPEQKKKILKSEEAITAIPCTNAGYLANSFRMYAFFIRIGKVKKDAFLATPQST